ncbi:hypothetical protein ElyMa_003570300 [Elysia marginata]|uniref:Uncharacterized protein n=1 Tax=Elysia marginata TaxID=1093978 RepID=A0AAV4EN98_9GAST|nr:hypothetical protein ElyMa_003570300 [Elysia marginata]
MPNSIGAMTHLCFMLLFFRKGSKDEPSYWMVPIMPLCNNMIIPNSLGGHPILGKNVKSPIRLTRRNALAKSINASIAAVVCAGALEEFPLPNFTISVGILSLPEALRQESMLMAVRSSSIVGCASCSSMAGSGVVYWMALSLTTFSLEKKLLIVFRPSLHLFAAVLDDLTGGRLERRDFDGTGTEGFLYHFVRRPVFPLPAAD